MRITFFIFLLMTFSLRNYSQTKEELDLFTFDASEDEFLRIDKIKQFQKKNPFHRNAIYHICRYYEENSIDSVHIFFDNLTEKYPDNVEPWLLRTEYVHFEIDYKNDSLYQSKKLEYLKKAYSIDKKNIEVNYQLSKLFYKDFIDPYTIVRIDTIKVIDKAKNDYTYTKIDSIKIKNKSVFIHPEDSALTYFHNLEQLSKFYKDILIFPIGQILAFKNIPFKFQLDSLMGISYNCYLPAWYFVNLPEKWEYNLSVNYLWQIEESIDHICDIKMKLEPMEEPCLYRINIPDSTEIYRFTYLEGDQNPDYITIRIEKCGSNIVLYWKKAIGNVCTRSVIIEQSNMRTVSINEWNHFIQLLNSANFNSFPKLESSWLMWPKWIMEKRTPYYYKAYETDNPKGFLGESCDYLIELTEKDNIKD